MSYRNGPVQGGSAALTMEFCNEAKRSAQKNVYKKYTRPGPGKCRHGVACWFQHRCWHIDNHTAAEKEIWAAEEKLRR